MMNDFKPYGYKPSAPVTFTDDQAKAVDAIITFIGAEFSPSQCIHSLCGSGGTGKTFVTKYIIENCKFSNSVIMCTAPTHKACRVFSNSIGGKEVITIQSAFGFRLDVDIDDFDPNNPNFAPKGTVKILERNTKLLIIDESSMLNSKLVRYIINLCRKKKIKILFIGDDFQLAPVKERNSTSFTNSNKISYLNQIVRQDYDNPIGNLLRILRSDIENNKYDFLNTISRSYNRQSINGKGEGFSVVGRTDFTNIICDKFSDSEFATDVDKYKTVAYTNANVTHWNKFIREKIVLGSDRGIITKNDLIMSNTTIVDDFNDPMIINSEDYIIKSMANFPDRTYDFKTYMVQFQAIHGGDISSPICVIDHTDNYTINQYYNVITSLVNEAKAAVNNKAAAWKRYYEFKKKYLLLTNIMDKQGKILVKRDIDYGFALTAHKSQGSTYGTVFVDVIDMVYDKNGKPYTQQSEILRRLYVACSRASKELILLYGR